MPSFDEQLSMGFFDGAKRDGDCGVGFLLQIKRDHIIHLWMG